jgi:hypothetical protein
MSVLLGILRKIKSPTENEEAVLPLHASMQIAGLKLLALRK